jgi:prolyl 4-hydroxylase
VELATSNSTDGGGGFGTSTVYAGNTVRQQRDLSTRSSSNTWLERSAAVNNLTDRLYRRAAHVLQIDESLLQSALPLDEDGNEPTYSNYHSLAESLQIVRYTEGEEYTAHHDFVYPPIRHRYQPTRFATLLFYLNDNFEGGKLHFLEPSTLNIMKVSLSTLSRERRYSFNNVLPDGNVDDLSQHASTPVTRGQKVSEARMIHG